MKPARAIRGERVGRTGRIAVGCAAAVFDPTGVRLLLVRRADNARWCVPGGYMDPGERVTECCEREVWEETGLYVHVTRLIGVYSDPDVLLTYPDGNRWQLVHLYFLAEPVGGALRSGEETTEAGFFAPSQIARLDLSGFNRRRVEDAFARQDAAFVRDVVRHD